MGGRKKIDRATSGWNGLITRMHEEKHVEGVGEKREGKTGVCGWVFTPQLRVKQRKKNCMERTKGREKTDEE